MVDVETIAFAHRLADAAGEVIRPYFRQRIEITDKGAAKGSVFDPVTEADKGAEKALRAIIERDRPDDGILGEEFG
jgi:fructose-1,6-bisphosphatase/inositol monophosphatase family enzyme